jgi:transposase-like protein
MILGLIRLGRVVCGERVAAVQGMLERGVIVSYETIRRWCVKFGQRYADSLRRRRPRPGDKWYLDEVFIKINGEQKYLWRGRCHVVGRVGA